MKKLAVLAAVLAVCAGYFMWSEWRSAFNISGIISVSPRLVRDAAKPNTECFIIVRNTVDIPVAVKHVINPVFPMQFSVKKEDLLLPNAYKDTLKLEVQVNRHGKLGSLQPGDMLGRSSEMLSHNTRGVQVTVDKMIGVPVLAANSTYGDKFQYIFKQTAR
ncbi:MAG TPA: hypothetical protein PLL10_10735 [Elusimicrobiales bacterium]|nr:hypothetical protein [Elusimicrobiales bacterium]